MFESIEFIKPVFNIEELPKDNLPEIVLAGRSNVGKSSFLNSVTGRKTIAKVSATPGKTRSLNYYRADNRFFVVDLPGYGYAKAGKADIRKWGMLIESYFTTSENIRLVLHLVDSRHSPTKLDLEFNAILRDFDIPSAVILTKSDKLKQSELKPALLKASAAIEGFVGIQFYSSVTGSGKQGICKIISKALSV